MREAFLPDPRGIIEYPRDPAGIPDGSRGSQTHGKRPNAPDREPVAEEADTLGAPSLALMKTRSDGHACRNQILRSLRDRLWRFRRSGVRFAYPRLPSATGSRSVSRPVTVRCRDPGGITEVSHCAQSQCVLASWGHKPSASWGQRQVMLAIPEGSQMVAVGRRPTESIHRAIDREPVAEEAGFG